MPWHCDQKVSLVIYPLVRESNTYTISRGTNSQPSIFRSRKKEEKKKKKKRWGLKVGTFFFFFFLLFSDFIASSISSGGPREGKNLPVDIAKDDKRCSGPPSPCGRTMLQTDLSHNQILCACTLSGVKLANYAAVLSNL